MDFETFEKLELEYVILRDISGNGANNPLSFLGGAYNREKALETLNELEDDDYILILDGRYLVTDKGIEYRKTVSDKLNSERTIDNGRRIEIPSETSESHISPIQSFPEITEDYEKMSKKSTGSIIMIILGAVFFLIGLLNQSLVLFGFCGSVLLPIGVFTPKRRNYCPSCNIAKDFDENCPKCGLNHNDGCLRIAFAIVLWAVLSAIAFLFFIMHTIQNGLFPPQR